MIKHSFLVIILLFMTTYVSARTKEEWKSRSIYQIVTDRFAKTTPGEKCDLVNYCGGTFEGIIEKLDYIKGMGFNAIMISPIVTNTERSYHGYNPIDFFKINSHFGTDESLKKLVDIAHENDIWVMLDVVVDHVGTMIYKDVNPFNKKEYYREEEPPFPPFKYDQEIIDGYTTYLSNRLKHEHKFVNYTLNEWIHKIIEYFDFDGIRIDSVPETPIWFWEQFRKSAGVFQMGEVFNGNPVYVSHYQHYLDSVINYPLYYTIIDSFCGSMKNIERYMFSSYFEDPSVLGVFVENHDNPRFLSRCKDEKKFKNAIIFSLMFQGIPIVYYGGEQMYNGGSDPLNREPLWPNYNTNSEMYIAIAAANKLRKEMKLWEQPFMQRYSDDVFYAFTRGDNILVALTRGEACERLITYHDFKDGDRLCNIFDLKDCITVEEGIINISMNTDPKIYVKQSN